MTKVTLTQVSAPGFQAASKQNANLNKITTAIENTLSRDGTGPNYMLAPLDMNNKRIINIGAPVSDNDAVRLKDLKDAAGDGLTIGGGGSTSTDWSAITGKPSTFEPTVESVQDIVGSQLVAGANVSVVYNDGTGTTTISATGGGGGVSLVDTITNGDTTNAVTPNAVYDALALKLDASAVTSSVTNGDTTHVPTSDAVFDAIAAVSGGGASVINSIASGDTTHAPSRDAVFNVLTLTNVDFVTHFGGNGDGSTNNDAAFALAEASSYDRIKLPEGTYVTTYTRTTLKKTYHGPGRIKMATNRWVQNFGSYDSNAAWTGNTEYGQDSVKNKFSDSEYKMIQAGTRVGIGEKYFLSAATPSFVEFRNDGGHSGISGLLSSSVSAGATTATIRNGTVGWNVGEVVYFQDPSGTYPDSRTITAVNTGTGTFSWTGGLSQGYPALSVVTHGSRTMNQYQLAILDHRGLGDAYIWTGRVIVEGSSLDSQDLFQYRKTGGMIGGDMTLAADGVYGTGIEMQYTDTGDSGHVGYDVCAANNVTSYLRTNNTGARDCFWIHDYVKCDNLAHVKPIDGVWVAAMKANVGLDLSRSTFTVGGTFNNAAIALFSGHRVYFNASTTYPGTGNGFTANTMGDSYIAHGSDGSGSLMDMWCGSYRVRARANGTLDWNGSFSSTGAITSGSNISSNSSYVSAGTFVQSTTYMNAGSFVQSGTYMSAGSYVNAATDLRVGGTKVVGARAGSIPDCTLDLGSACSTLNSLLAVLRTHGLHT